MKLIEEHRSFGGTQYVYSHLSSFNRCTMHFALFLPPEAKNNNVPVLFWLSGLSCNEQNFITKAGAQRVAAELGLAIVCPDTSPRGIKLPGDDDCYDFGVGAGYYLDAIEKPWAQNYQMESYITKELTPLVFEHFPVDQQQTGIFGHSMGGHGALTLALKNPHLYKTVSAFAPICAPMHCPWGQKAFTGYLGTNQDIWKNYDACELIKKHGWPHQTILIDQGTADPFLQEQLNPELFRTTCLQAGVDITLRMQLDYDHGYYFIASFIEDHLRFHAAQNNPLP